jgi:adenosylmethionine---8-amino-7-oxononanoate aminotransferase
MDKGGKVWYPFMQMATAPQPIKIVKGKGTLIYDDKGKIYIDAISSWWVNLHGHANKKIAKAVSKQLSVLEHVIFSGFTHQPAEELAEKIIGILPKGFSHMFYSDNGSTAVEVALKMAIQYHANNKQKKLKIIALEGSYHGDTFGAMSVGERGIFNQPFHDLMFEVQFFDIQKQSVAEFEKLCSEEVAAFIFEPLVQGAGGMLMHDEKVLDELLTIAKQHGIICIADEVMTGFGRTGKLFAINHLQQLPDIICLSKGITGGTMALGATFCNQKIFDAFYDMDKSKTFYHGHSYTANPLACTAALASFDILKSKKCLLSIDHISEQHQQFAEKLKKLSNVENVRCRGTILAFDVKDNNSGYLSPIRDRLYHGFLDMGVLLRPLGNTVYIMPPYVITDKQLMKVYKSILKVLVVIDKG